MRRKNLNRDLKPENILMGLKSQSNQVFLVDFGIAKRLNAKDLNFPNIYSFVGTIRYAKVSAHLGVRLGRKDDLESLVYVLIFLYRG